MIDRIFPKKVIFANMVAETTISDEISSTLDPKNNELSGKRVSTQKLAHVEQVAFKGEC